MKMLFIVSYFISICMNLTLHPMMMVLLISSQTTLLCLILLLYIQTSWFSFILFLVFMGGLMVLFVYVSSLAYNEKFSFHKNYNSYPQFLPHLIIPLVIATMTLMNYQQIKTFNINLKSIIFKIYSPEMALITSVTMIYLLLMLIIIVSLATLKKGPLRAFMT